MSQNETKFHNEQSNMAFSVHIHYSKLKHTISSLNTLFSVQIHYFQLKPHRVHTINHINERKWSLNEKHRSSDAVKRRKRRKNYVFNLIIIKQQQMQCEKCVWLNMINILLDIIYTCLHILRFSQMLSRLISVDFTNIFIV